MGGGRVFCTTAAWLEPFPAWGNHLATRTQLFKTAPREAEPFIVKFSLWFEWRIVKSRVITFPVVYTTQ